MRCRRRDIEVWRSGALEACCTCRDVQEEPQRYRNYGDALLACGRGDVEVRRSGALESCRGCRIGTLRRHRGMELWTSRDALQACRRGDAEV